MNKWLERQSQCSRLGSYESETSEFDRLNSVFEIIYEDVADLGKCRLQFIKQAAAPPAVDLILKVAASAVCAVYDLGRSD